MAYLWPLPYFSCNVHEGPSSISNNPCTVRHKTVVIHITYIDQENTLYKVTINPLMEELLLLIKMKLQGPDYAPTRND